MPFDFFDGVGAVLDLLSLDLGSSSKFSSDEKKKNKKSKYRGEIWSTAFLVVAFFLLFIIFKDPLPEKNLAQSIIVCSLIGLVISFIIFFSLYHLGLYYFKSIFKFLFFSCSLVLLMITIVLCIYFKSNLFSL